MLLHCNVASFSQGFSQAFEFRAQSEGFHFRVTRSPTVLGQRSVGLCNTTHVTHSQQKKMASFPTALIQGANRGIGLQFCRHLLSKKTSVIATCRNPSAASCLADLKSKYGDLLSVYSLDVTQEEQIEQVANTVEQVHTGKLDLLINCSGLLHPTGKGETSLKEVTLKGLSTTFNTNAFGPLLMAKYFGPMLSQGNGAFGDQSVEKSQQHAGVLVNISARVGSISDNNLGGWYSYRMSKAALNMATKTVSIELGRRRGKAVLCVSLHPGTVDTDLSRRYHRNVEPGRIFTPEYSVNCLMEIVETLTLQDNGKFFAWDGKEIPW